MIITATQKNTRQTALKVRLVANQVRKLPLVDAIKQLGVMQKRASLTVLKVLRQAIANAIHNHGYVLDDLRLKNIVVTSGPTYKRFRAVSRGRAHTIFKRTCHIVVELEAGVAPKSGEETKQEKNDMKAEVVVKNETTKSNLPVKKAVAKKPAVKKKTVKKNKVVAEK